jgi:hypothetical protein
VVVSTIALGALLTAGVIGVRSASADDLSMPIAERLAERFDLNQDEVQAVFDAVRDERHEEMQIQLEEKLNELVSEGVLTTEQMNSFLAKHEDMRPEKGEMSALTMEQRHERMQTHHEELRTWAEENGVDLDELRSELGRGMGKGFKAGHHFGVEGL